jgi:hypothetical protein
MCEIFLSYDRSDKKAATRLVEALEAQGYRVFWDRDIPAGMIWDESIEQKLKRAKCVVVLWSKASVRSLWVKAEATEGAARAILVPAMLDNTKAPLMFRPSRLGDLLSRSGLSKP